MKVLIAQASKDENNQYIRGKAGDQTGEEVFIREWFDMNWHTCLRPIDQNVAKKSAEAAIYLAESNIVGYDQKQRNSLHALLVLHKYHYENIKMKCECDCSSFVTCCALCGGINELEYVVNAPVTGNMVEIFLETGQYEAYIDKKHLQSCEYLEVGDILVCEGHTVIVVSKGEKDEKDS